jgi:hypothetical protein
MLIRTRHGSAVPSRHVADATERRQWMLRGAVSTKHSEHCLRRCLESALYVTNALARSKGRAASSNRRRRAGTLTVEASKFAAPYRFRRRGPQQVAGAPPGVARHSASGGGRISRFIAPCLPTKAPTPSGAEWLHEIKHDGFRVIARKDGERVKLYSRPGNDLTDRFPRVASGNAGEALRQCSPSATAEGGPGPPDPRSSSDFHFLPGKNGTGFSQTPISLGCGDAVPRIVVWRFLKNSPHGIHAKPRHLGSKKAPGRLKATTKVPRTFRSKLDTGTDCTERSPKLRYRRRQSASKWVSLAMSGQTTILSSHTACAQVPI